MEECACLPRNGNLTEILIRHLHQDTVHHQGRGTSWSLDHKRTLRRSTSNRKVRRLPQTPWRKARAEDVRPSWGAHHIYPTLHILWYGRLRTLVYQGGPQDLEAVWHHLHVPGFKSSPPWNAELDGSRLFHQRTATICQQTRESPRSPLGPRNKFRGSKKRASCCPERAGSETYPRLPPVQGLRLDRIQHERPSSIAHGRNLGASHPKRSSCPLRSAPRNGHSTGWRSTTMTEAENVINSRPLSIQDLADPESAEPLTPNHLLTLKTDIALRPPGDFQRPDLYSRKRWRRVQYMTNQFWIRWQQEYFTLQYKRQKWNVTCRDTKVGDIVLIREGDLPRNHWPLARVTRVYPSKDGLIRKVQLLVTKDGKRSTLERPVHKLIFLLSE